jgi:cyclopropane fatty-acyl-phospholipid synthase-like methyltransferase
MIDENSGLKSRTMLSKNYRNHYLGTERVYPSVFALKFFLGRNPTHDSGSLGKLEGADILDIGFGDGRDMLLYNELGMNVFGVEIDHEVVLHTQRKFRGMIPAGNIKIGTNLSTEFGTKKFDYVTAFSSLFYLESEDATMGKVLAHVATLLKNRSETSNGNPGQLFCTLAREGTHALRDADRLNANTYILEDGFYSFRKGQRYFAFNDAEEVEKIFDESGLAVQSVNNFEVDWFGSLERLFVVKARAT